MQGGRQMYDGKQVLRFHTQYKSSDIYNIGNEMERRKGTGNYDKDRTLIKGSSSGCTAYNELHDDLWKN